jgi:hypothetical protein
VTTQRGLENPEIHFLLSKCVDAFRQTEDKLPEFILIEDALKPLVTQMPQAPFIQVFN